MAFDSTGKGYRALIFGASGITGWALTAHALIYPSPHTFERVVALTHRPLSQEDAQLPESPRLELFSGINLEKDVSSQLEKIPEIEKITHVFFAAYTGHGSSYEELKAANIKILENALAGLEKSCPAMQFFTLQTGGKAYGIEFTEHVKIPVPTPESTPRIPEPWASNIFYYAQYDIVAAASQKSKNKWQFCEIRPDVIVGFVPRGNAMNAAQCLGFFLSLWRDIEGEGTEVPFPGDERAWTVKRTDTSQDVLARFHIFASTHPDAVHGKAFNVADGKVVAWKDVWEGICQWFGLVGVGPKSGVLSGSKWVESKKEEWKAWEEKKGVKKGVLGSTDFGFMAAVVEGPNVDRQYDLSACREVGFKDEVNTVAGYHIAFDRLKKANIIP